MLESLGRLKVGILEVDKCTFSAISKDIACMLSKFQAIFRHSHFFGFTLPSYLKVRRYGVKME